MNSTTNEQSILEALLLRLDSPDEDLQVVTAPEVVTWPEPLFDLLCHNGMLVPTTPSHLYTCTSCSDEHDEEVFIVKSPPGSPRRFYIQCPSVGRVRVDPDDLRQWRLAPEGWARIIRRLLGLTGSCRESIPGRVWRMGVVNLDGVHREAMLVRGLSWTDGGSLRGQITSIADSIPPILVIPYRMPNDPLTCLLPLAQVLRLVDGELLLDRDVLDSIVAGWPTTATPPAKAVERDEFRHSEDFRTVQLRGVTYNLTTRQAQVIEVLHQVYQDGMPEVSQESIVDRIGSQSDTVTIRDIFRRLPNWKTLVTHGKRRGTFSLNY